MEPNEKARFDTLYESHLRALKLRGLSDSTIDVYSRAVREDTGCDASLTLSGVFASDLLNGPTTERDLGVAGRRYRWGA